MTKGLRLIIGVFILIFLLSILYIFYTYNPETHSMFPGCPFFLVTGYECPGCGSQRAIYHLLHFNLRESVGYNVLMVASIPYILLGVYLEYFGGKTRSPKLSKIFFGRRSALIVLIIIIAYWILRNIF